VTTPRQSLGDRIYRWLLRLFPAAFRGDFGSDMQADFGDQCADARRSGRLTLARLWGRTVSGMLITAVRMWSDDLVQDARMVLRSMRRSPGFTAAAVVMFALGTGASAVTFSIIDAVLVRSPFPDANRLVIVQEANAGRVTNGFPLSHLDRIRTSPIFAAVAVLGGGSAVLTDNGASHRQDLECVSASMFDVLGAPPLLGRTLQSLDDGAGSAPVVVLSYATWQRDFGGDDGVVGRQIHLNGTPATIVGVMPSGFLGPLSRNSTEMWAPLGPAVAGTSPIGCHTPDFVNLFARLAPGITFDAARRRAADVAVADLPDWNGATGATVRLTTLDEQTFGDLRAPLLALLGAVACMLLIACANVANLQLERIVSRGHEIAVRRALGASTGRIVRQTLTENVVLGGIGAAAGIGLASLALPFVVSLMPGYIPHLREIVLRPEVLGAALALALVASAVVGLLPAVQATSRELADATRTASRSMTHTSQWPRRLLVVVEIALSVALLIGAGLTVRTFLALRPANPGFNPAGKLVASVRLDGPFVPNVDNAAFFDRVLARLREQPGVAHASGTTYIPMVSGVDDRRAVANGTTRDVWLSAMTVDYLRDVEITIVQGRAFSDTDGMQAPPVAMVNETAARAFWPDESPLNQSITLSELDGGTTTRRIVGVTNDTRTLGNDLRKRAEMYIPYAQSPTPALDLVVTASGNAMRDLAKTIRQIVDAERPGQVVARIDNFQERVDYSVAGSRFSAWIFGAFGVIAVVLAATGLGAVVTWRVTQRTKEIGIRVALGATSGHVTRLVLSEALALVVAGITTGLAVAFASTRLLSSWLYPITPLDAPTFAVCTALMLAVAATASWVPALRAARVDPVVALRAE
jgi:putative ABC transport system permease protein